MFSLTPWRKDETSALANRTEHPLSLFRNEFDSLFDRFIGDWSMHRPNWAGTGVDIDESENDLTVRVDAPGFEADDFDVQVSGDVLRISAHRKSGNGKKGSIERQFQRSLSLSAAVDVGKVGATYKNGVLELTLPKTEQSKWKKIAVKG